MRRQGEGLPRARARDGCVWPWTSIRLRCKTRCFNRSSAEEGLVLTRTPVSSASRSSLPSLESFHPAVSEWFRREIGVPTPPQRDGWPEIAAGRATLIAAPTGSGKTLAAFLSAIDGLVRDGLAGTLGDEARILYVSPLKALGNDIQRNLEMPLAGIARELESMGLPRVDIRTMVRTGDTSNRDRTRMVSRPPHIVVTTPESLYILLTSEGGRRLLHTIGTVIVDEVHALVGSKRGSHLALSLARLDALTRKPPPRIGQIGS